MGFEEFGGDARFAANVQAGLAGHDFDSHDHVWSDFAETHSDQTAKADVRLRHQRLKPKFAVRQKKESQHKAHQPQYHDHC